MTVSKLFRRLVGVALGIVSLTLPGTLAAQDKSHAAAPPLPSPHELARVSPSGSYLAARHATTPVYFLIPPRHRGFLLRWVRV